MPMSVSPHRYLIVVLMPLPAVSLAVRFNYFIVAPRPLPAAPLVLCCR
jgi:hypothetical protein